MIVCRPGFGKYGGTMDTDFRTRRCFLVFGATGGDLRVGAPNADTVAEAIERDGAVHDEKFVAYKPLNEVDARARGQCTATGFWAGGHAMTTYKGRKYIKEYAPTGE